MFRKILPYILMFLAVVLDISVLPMVSSSYLMPILSLVLLISLSMLLSGTYVFGLICGALGGLLLDITVGYAFGLQFFLYTAVGAVATLGGQARKSHVSATVVTAFALLLLYELIMLVYQYMVAATMSPDLIGHALLRVLIETGLCQVLYMFFLWVLRPENPRYSSTRR